jgi:hypothetical protein
MGLMLDGKPKGDRNRQVKVEMDQYEPSPLL